MLPVFAVLQPSLPRNAPDKMGLFGSGFQREGFCLGLTMPMVLLKWKMRVYRRGAFIILHAGIAFACSRQVLACKQGWNFLEVLKGSPLLPSLSLPSETQPGWVRNTCSFCRGLHNVKINLHSCSVCLPLNLWQRHQPWTFTEAFFTSSFLCSSGLCMRKL